MIRSTNNPPYFLLLLLFFLTTRCAHAASNNNTFTVSNFEAGRALACSCLTERDNTTNSGNLTTQNTFTIQNVSSEILLTCNNSLGKIKVYNATESFYNQVEKLFTNMTTSSRDVPSASAYNTSNKLYLFRQKIAANNDTYYDFFGCYSVANTSVFKSKKNNISTPSTVTLLHIIATLMVLMMAYFVNSCLFLTRRRALRRKVQELPRIKQIFTPMLISKTSTFIQVVNEATRAKKLGSHIVQSEPQKFKHLGCGFAQQQTYRSLVEYSLSHVEETIASIQRGGGVSIPLRRTNDQTVRQFLLVVVPMEMNLTHATQYKDRVQTYVRLYERARFGGGSFTASDLSLALEEVRWMNSVFRSS